MRRVLFATFTVLLALSIPGVPALRAALAVQAATAHHGCVSCDGAPSSAATPAEKKKLSCHPDPAAGGDDVVATGPASCGCHSNAPVLAAAVCGCQHGLAPGVLGVDRAVVPRAPFVVSMPGTRDAVRAEPLRYSGPTRTPDPHPPSV